MPSPPEIVGGMPILMSAAIAGSGRETWEQIAAEYVDPVQHPKGSLDFDAAFFGAIVQAWREMTDDGRYLIPIFVEHRESEWGSGRAGHIRELAYRQGDGLWARIQWEPAGWAERGARPYISPGWVRGYSDERGRTWDMVLWEASITATPHLHQNAMMAASERPQLLEVAMPGEKEEKDKAAMAEPAAAPDWKSAFDALRAQVEEAIARVGALEAKRKEDKAEEEVKEETAEMACKKEDMSEETPEVKAMREKLAAYQMADATRDVDALITGKRLLPAAKDEWVKIRMSDGEQFTRLAAGLPVVDLTGAIGAKAPAPTAVTGTVAERRKVRAEVLMRENKIPADAALRQAAVEITT